MSDDIEKTFASLTPSDLMVDQPHFLEMEVGGEGFDAFIDRHIYSTRYAFMAADGDINTVSALSDGRRERLFVPSDDDTIAEFLQRLGTTARATGSTRFFWSRMSPTTMTQPVGHQLGDEANWVPSIIWYAEDSLLDNGKRYGRMLILAKDSLGEREDAPLFGGDIADHLKKVLRN